MSGRPWYKRYPTNFIQGTMRLSLEEKGAYSILLDLIYDHGGPIEDDPRYIAGVCNCSIRKWTVVRDRLVELGKITVADGRISNKRAEFEIENALKSSRERAESGSKGGRNRAENASSSRDNNTLGQAELKHTRAFQKLEPELETRSAPIGALSEARPKAAEAKAAMEAEFDQTFWPAYPEKVGKQPAQKAWAKARRGADLATIMAGLDRYIACKPPDRAWMHPATFLNNSRWEDQYPARPTGASHERSHGRQQSQHDDLDAAFANIAARRDVRESSGSDRERPFAPPDSFSTRELSLDRGTDGSFSHRGFRPELIVGRR